jgi:hypothetical protein
VGFRGVRYWVWVRYYRGARNSSPKTEISFLGKALFFLWKAPACFFCSFINENPNKIYKYVSTTPYVYAFLIKNKNIFKIYNGNSGNSF